MLLSSSGGAATSGVKGMTGGHLFSVRSTRLVAGGRAVLAAFLAVGVAFGSLSPSVGGELVRPLLMVYLVYSVAVLAVSRSRGLAYRLLRAPLIPSALDIAVFMALLYMTNGAESPFFSPLVFLILSATIQWGSRGAVAMGGITLALFLPAALVAAVGDGHGGDAALTTIVRLGYIVVVTVLLAAFGRHLERVIDELSRLSDPVQDGFNQGEPPMSQALKHALRVFGARRGALLWVDGEEPYVHVVECAGDRYQTRTLPPSGEEWLVEPSLARAVFMFDRASGVSVARSGARTVLGPKAPLSAMFLSAYNFDRVLVVPLQAEPLEGWIFIFDHEEPATEDFAIGSMLSAQASTSLERWEAHRTHREAAAAADRVRLARDLHDGVLQFLAGAALQLEGLLRARDLPAGPQARLAALKQALTDEQRELRSFISATREVRGDADVSRHHLELELRELADRLSRYWNISVQARAVPAEARVSVRMGYDVGRLVREAVANAVRHGEACHVDVAAAAEDGWLKIEITDDGHGFAFEGELTDGELLSSGQGPRSLQERAQSLGGRVGLRSGAGGSSLVIELPLPRIGA